jgi:hypothetical protein
MPERHHIIEDPTENIPHDWRGTAVYFAILAVIGIVLFSIG